MSRRLDIGVASYRNAAKLRRTLESIRRQSVTDWRCFIIHNPSEGDDDVREVIAAITEDLRFRPLLLRENVGYAGAVNALMTRAETEYLAYCDNDIEILTPGWDEALCSHLDRFHEIGMIFPNGGAYPIDRGAYREVMWQAGFCWVLNRLAMTDTGYFDAEIGHQNECDYCLRLRMAGWKCAAVCEVRVSHHATASNDPASIERISRGVIQFVEKWCKAFGGKSLGYHSTNVLRWHDWPPNALYLEEYFKINGLAALNINPESVTINGEKFDLIKVPRLSGFYTGRVI